MAKYKLSNLARSDLLEIAKWGDKTHGIKRSNEYRSKLEKHLNYLAENPLLYPEVNHIRKGYRRSICGVHSIYYRINHNIIEVMTVVRVQDLKNRLN